MGFINWKRGRKRLNDMGLLKRLVEDLRAQRPDHVAVTGDLVNIGMPVEFQRAASWMETSGEPSDVSFVPGNHDAYVRASMPMLGTTFAPWATSDGTPKSKATYPYLRVRGEIAIIGLSSAVPTAPLMATGRLGKKQIEAFAELCAKPAPKTSRGSCSSITRLWPGRRPRYADFGRRRIRARRPRLGAEAILHGHIHRQAVRSLPSRAARTVGGAVPVLSAPSAAAAAITRAIAPPIISFGLLERASVGGSARASEG